MSPCSRWRILVLVLAAVVASSRAAETLTTVRFGEQDSCRVRDVTSLSWDAGAGRSRIRFDLARLPKRTKLARAVLRFWVNGLDGKLERTWGFGRWRTDAFDGFNVWQGRQPSRDGLLDTKYPFNTPTYWLFEFDVTHAARRWAAEPSANEGLTTNFPFPVGLDGPAETAWQRPHLQVTYAGANPDRPKQPTELKAFYRSGQVFLTWKQSGGRTVSPGARVRGRPRPFFDATYRVYRHTAPITAENLDRARRLGEVTRLSQLNYRRTMTARGGSYGPWRYYVQAAGQPAQKKGESRADRRRRVLEIIPRRFNFVIDDTWPGRIEGGEFLRRPKESERVQIYEGPQLGDDTGLFVHTCREAASAYYAVTSVVDGNENRRDFTAANALAEPIAGKRAAPKPVLQAVFTANGPEGWRKVGKFQVREYVYWSGAGRGHTQPSTPLCFTFHVPRRWVKLGYSHGPEIDRDFPAWVCSLAKVAGYSISYWDGRGVVMDTGYMPPTPQAPFPPGGAQNMDWGEYGRFYYGSRTPPAKAPPRPRHVVRSVYGYVETINSGADPRSAVVRPYFENRRLFELDFVLKRFGADPNYVWASGEGSTLNFAVHHADRIGSGETAQERPWKSERGAPQHEPLVGLRRWGLKNDLGHNVWDYNDPVWLAERFRRRDWPCIANCHSDNYDGADNWAALGLPRFYEDLAKARRVAQLWWCDIGDAPNGKFLAVAVNQAYPVFSNVTCCQKPAENWRDEPRGTLNGYVVWHRPTRPFVFPRKIDASRKDAPKPPPGRPLAYAVSKHGRKPIFWAARRVDLVDTPARFEIALRIGEDGLMLNGQSVPPCRVACGAADVSLRRLQAFRTQPGDTYAWRNVRVSSGRLLQSGTGAADKDGALTVRGVFVDKDVLGNKLIVERAGEASAPRPDTKGKVVVRYFTDRRKRHHGEFTDLELSYDEYVARCRKPELVPVVRPDRVFTIDDFLNARGFRGDGLYSQWGGGFDDALHFGAAGRYRVEVRTSESYFQHVAWPILDLSVDGRAVGERLLDSTRPTVRTWWVDLTEGRHLVRFWLRNNIFNEPFPRHGDQDRRPDRGFRLLGVRFVHLGEAARQDKGVYAVRIRQRSLVVPPAMPLRLSADVRDRWGRALQAAVTWTAADGARITPEGVFSADKGGAYSVTASAGGRRDTVTVRVGGGAWIENFDDEWLDGWSVAPPAQGNAPQAPHWTVSRHHGWVGMLCQRSRRATDDSAIVWDAGGEWADVAIAVDRMPASSGRPLGQLHGLLFRYRDAGNHYRFDVRRGKDKARLRLLKRVGGRQTILKTAERSIEPLRIAETKDYPSFRFWSPGRVPKELEVDRFEIEARGAEIAAKLNGRTIFSVTDSDLKRGTVGLCCRAGGVFDNLRVRPLP